MGSLGNSAVDRPRTYPTSKTRPPSLRGKDGASGASLRIRADAAIFSALPCQGFLRDRSPRTLWIMVFWEQITPVLDFAGHIRPESVDLAACRLATTRGYARNRPGAD